MIKNILSISGGKDSTAMLAYALEQETENMQVVFCDTGHEHQITYEYIDYLEDWYTEKTGDSFIRLKADFSKQIKNKRKFIKNNWVKSLIEKYGYSKEEARIRVRLTLKSLHPTGNPFLDLALWKSRFPSTRRRFCTQELKINPTNKLIEKEMIGAQAVICWHGVRAQESKAREGYPMYDVEFGEWEPEPQGHLIYRPLINWTHDEVFEFHRKHGVKWNPLYEQGMGRVGCMPCVNTNKRELAQISRRFIEELERVAVWERMVGNASKRGNSTFFASTTDPVNRERDIKKVTYAKHGIIAVAEYAKTSRGGRQFDLIEESLDHTQCNSIYGLCE